MYFTAIEPPGNIQKPLYQLQTMLFRRFGLGTARLFPPLAPVFPGRLTEELRESILRTLEELNSFEAEAVIDRRDGLFFSPLRVRMRDEDRAAVLEYPKGVKRGPLSDRLHGDLFFPDRVAVFLACGEPAGENWSGRIPGMADGTPLRFRKADLVEISIDCERGPGWYEDLCWEYTDKISVRCGMD